MVLSIVSINCNKLKISAERRPYCTLCLEVPNDIWMMIRLLDRTVRIADHDDAVDGIFPSQWVPFLLRISLTEHHLTLYSIEHTRVTIRVSQR